MRIFVALELSESLTDGVAQVATRLRYSVKGRYVSSKLYHVTLAFIGEMEASQLPQVYDAVDAACAGATCIETSLGPLGSFGRGDTCLIWQGFPETDARAMTDLGYKVRTQLKNRGIAFDKKPMKPHVTVVRDAIADPAYLAGIESYVSGRAERVTVFQSILGQGAPRYVPLYSVDLAEPKA